MSLEAAALILAWGAIVLLAFAMAGLLRQVGALNAALSGEAPFVRGPLPGQPLPAELAAAVSGNGSAGSSLFLFMDSECPGCEAIAPEVSRLVQAGEIDLRLVFRGRAEHLAHVRSRALEGMAPAFETLGIPATPFAVRASADAGVLAAAPVGSAEALQEFLSNSNEVKS